MSDAAPAGAPHERPTNVRFLIVALATFSALLMYVDRLCVGIAEKDIATSLELNKSQTADFQTAFFLGYALFMVPAGFLSDRMGPRLTLTLYIIVWSMFTGLIGFAEGLTVALIGRFGVGLGQAGAYPASGSLLRDWIPVQQRAMASATVAVGGRMGAVIAPILTVGLIDLAGWRGTFIGYGLFGIVFAVVFWLLFRGRPELHPWTNHAERELILGDLATRPKESAVAVANPSFPIMAILRSVSLWGNSVCQFATNVGWLFLAIKMPAYLSDVHHVDKWTQGYMTAIPPIAGIAGMLLGGRVTDWLAPRVGLQASRRLPILFTRFSAALGYAIAIGLSYAVPPASQPTWMPWVYVLPFSLVYFSTDFGNPAIWSYAQDVGGKFVASVLAWANMWGNLGAAAAPKLYNLFLSEKPTLLEWNTMFALCAGAYLVAAAGTVFIDSSEKIG